MKKVQYKSKLIKYILIEGVMIKTIEEVYNTEILDYWM